MQASARRNFAIAAKFAAVALCASLVTEMPAKAQFWGGWGGWDRRPQPPQRVPQPYNPFGNLFGPGLPPGGQREAPADYSHAPGPQKKSDPSAANTIVVVGDGMADWLAYGLEEAFAEKPEFAILRKHRTTSGLIRYDTRRDVEWSQVIKEIIAADKPKFIVMMIGINDRQQIRERAGAPTHVTSRPPATAKPSQPEPAPADPELQAQQSADQQNAEQQEAPNAQPPAAAAEPRGAQNSAGPFEFHTEKWESAYIRRIDATIMGLKSAAVPVFWVGLPAQRNSRASSDSAYLNELYRQQAEKAGIAYIDIWDGFVDDAGRFSPQGPDFEGQTRRLRAGDGVYFTKAGARKLAHYVEREIQRNIASRTVPVALPLEPSQAPPGGRSGAAAARPLAGPVVPLTVSTGGGDELLGGARGARPSAADPIATRVLTRGEPLSAPTGRADDFSWPRGLPPPASTEPAGAALSSRAVTPPATSKPKDEPAAAGPAKSRGAAAAQGEIPDAQSGDTKPARPRRARNNPPPTDAAPRPPLSIRPPAVVPQGAR